MVVAKYIGAVCSCHRCPYACSAEGKRKNQNDRSPGGIAIVSSFLSRRVRLKPRNIPTLSCPVSPCFDIYHSHILYSVNVSLGYCTPRFIQEVFRRAPNVFLMVEWIDSFYSFFL